MEHFLFKTQIVLQIHQKLDSKMLGELLLSIKNIFNPDVLPTSIPLDKDAPEEIPRLIFTSKNKEENLNIAQSRLDYIYSPADFSKNNINNLNTINTESFIRVANLLSEKHIPYTKCGIIIEVISPQEDPNVIFDKVKGLDIFFCDKSNEPDVLTCSFTLAKQTTKKFEEYGVLLQNYYVNTGVVDTKNNKKFHLFGIDMNNFNGENESISKPKKIEDFLNFVFSELKLKIQDL